MNDINLFMRDDSGATMIEYALLVALIAIVVMTALGPLGTNLATKFTNITTAIGT